MTPALALAQGATTTGTVRGVVTGPAGKSMADVTVIATNQETGVRRATVSRPGGEYRLAFLDPGVYTIKAQIIVVSGGQDGFEQFQWLCRLASKWQNRRE